MDERGRIGPVEVLLYAIVAAYLAAGYHVFSGLLALEYGFELLVIAAGLAAFIWLAGLAAVVPSLLHHVAVFEAARGVSKAGSGVREWGRAQRDRYGDYEDERGRGGPPYRR